MLARTQTHLGSKTHKPRGAWLHKTKTMGKVRVRASMERLFKSFIAHVQILHHTD
jgi:hypothetical protein